MDGSSKECSFYISDCLMWVSFRGQGGVSILMSAEMIETLWVVLISGVEIKAQTILLDGDLMSVPVPSIYINNKYFVIFSWRVSLQMHMDGFWISAVSYLMKSSATFLGTVESTVFLWATICSVIYLNPTILLLMTTHDSQHMLNLWCTLCSSSYVVCMARQALQVCTVKHINFRLKMKAAFETLTCMTQ